MPKALGGSINLVPRTGAEHGGEPFLDTDFGYGYEPLRDTPVYHAEFSAGRGFDGGDGIGGWFAGPNAFSAVITAVYHQDKRGVDDIEESYTDQQSSGVPDKVLSNLQFRRYEYARDRYGAAANFDARPADGTRLYLPDAVVRVPGARKQALPGAQRTRLERRMHSLADLHPGPQ